MAKSKPVSLEQRLAIHEAAQLRLDAMGAEWLEHRAAGLVPREIDERLTDAIDEATRAESKLRATRKRLNKRG